MVGYRFFDTHLEKSAWQRHGALEMPVAILLLLAYVAVERTPETGSQEVIEEQPVVPSGPVALQHVVHQRAAAALGDDARALHEDFLRLDEIEPRVSPDPRMNVRVHADRIARAGFDAI